MLFVLYSLHRAVVAFWSSSPPKQLGANKNQVVQWWQWGVPGYSKIPSLHPGLIFVSWVRIRQSFKIHTPYSSNLLAASILLTECRRLLWGRLGLWATNFAYYEYGKLADSSNTRFLDREDLQDIPFSFSERHQKHILFMLRIASSRLCYISSRLSLSSLPVVSP